MSDDWNTIREAAVAKMAGSSLMAAAGLRTVDARTDGTNGRTRPCMKVLPPIITVEAMQNAWVTEYTVELRWELLLGVPSGKARSEPKGIQIVRAMDEEWRNGYLTGMPSSVVDVRLSPAQDGLVEYAEDADDGYHGSVLVQVYETHSARTP